MATSSTRPGADVSADRATTPARRTRVDSVDVVRGLIMIIMALDHTRDYFAIPGQKFFNTTKYPPSLLFLLMTLGPALLLLRAVDGGTPRLLRPALVIGKVPLFYYMLHFFFIHLLAVVVCYARYGTAHWMFESPTLASYPFTTPPGWGYSLPVVYLVWLVVVVTLYPLCQWFAALKQRRSDAWLSYL